MPPTFITNWQHWMLALTLMLWGLFGLGLAYLSMAWMGSRIPQPLPEVTAATSPKRASKQQDSQRLKTEALLTRHLFTTPPTAKGSPPPPPTGEPNLPEAPQMVDKLPNSLQHLELVGTINAGSQRSSALLQQGNKIELYHLGDNIPQAGKLVRIQRRAVLVRLENGKHAKLRLDPDNNLIAPAKEAPQAPPASGKDSSRSRVNNLGRHRYEIPRNVAQQARANLGQLLQQARVVPYTANGTTQGFQVVMLQQNSLFAELGLQKGDVIKQVNGTALDSPEQAIRTFQRLRRAEHIELDLLRSGEPVTLTYRIR